MVIGAGWKKKDKKGKQFLSVSISLPFLGSVNFMLYVNENKKNTSSPDYSVVWFNDKDEKKSKSNGNAFSDEDIPF